MPGGYRDPPAPREVHGGGGRNLISPKAFSELVQKIDAKFDDHRV
jgi:hypothetical protein